MQSLNNRDRWWHLPLRSKVCAITIVSSTIEVAARLACPAETIEMASRIWLCLEPNDEQTRVLFNTDRPKQSKMDNKDAEANKI